jgi:hypothetical protein
MERDATVQIRVENLRADRVQELLQFWEGVKEADLL